MWYDERLAKCKQTRNPKFGLCCLHGKIQLPPKHEPPHILHNLLQGMHTQSKHFRDNIRMYNMMFAFTSMGGKIDKDINTSRGPYVYRISGQNVHMIGSVLPPNGSSPKFAQLYIYDTNNEVSNRMFALRGSNEEGCFAGVIVSKLKDMLDECNPLVKVFRAARDMLGSAQSESVQIRLVRKRGTDGRRYNLPTSTNEIAALIVGDIGSTLHDRDIVVQYKTGLLQRISETHPLYLPMQYPLLFPYGEDGYRDDVPHSEQMLSLHSKKNRVTQREYFTYMLQDRVNQSSTILIAGKLFQQFLVDGYTMIESARLSYIRNNQKQLRADIYSGLADAVLNGETNPSSLGKRIILPSSFTGGARYTIQNFQDAMAICRWAGYPDLFITFTCNPKWPEINRALADTNLRPEDRPDILSRLFKMKLDMMMRDITKKSIFGKVKAVVYTIEFQKCGLPHAHILVFLFDQFKYPTPSDIDKVISAEIPDINYNPKLFEAVSNFMMHGPCGAMNHNSPCMVDGICSKHYPKAFNSSTIFDIDGYPRYRRPDNGKFVMKNGMALDNRFVVPYNPKLLLKYYAHINVERCNQSESIKYLFKYVNKGHDRVTIAFYAGSSESIDNHVHDEIKMFYDCRYLSACEAAWRIFLFEINYRQPSVERLSFHLPDQQSVMFQDDEQLDSVLDRNLDKPTMFLAWFEANKKYPEAREVTYANFPTLFVYKKDLHEWHSRKSGTSIGRMFFTPPGSGELHYLRTLLNFVKGATSYEDIRTIDGVLYPTFRDACYALGLLDDDKEYIDGIMEASHWASTNFIRRLFCMLLTCNALSRPEFVWEKTWMVLSDDITHRQRLVTGHQGLHLSDNDLQNFTLIEIEKMLQSNGRSLKDYHQMPYPNMSTIEMTGNKLIYEQLNYDKHALTTELSRMLETLTFEQRNIYDAIIGSIESGNGGVFFVYGYGGTGKTYIWNTMSASLRSRGKIVLNVASSGIASLLLPGGRTAHSQFCIPLSINEDSICNIKQCSPLADLIAHTSLIIWDEAPMANKYCFEALDRTMRDILHLQNSSAAHALFGGKVVVFGGDFRQILPVIPRGTQEDIVFASINSSYMWNDCKLMTLTKNMRLLPTNSHEQNEELNEFAKWIISIGDGTITADIEGEAEITIPHDLLLWCSCDPIKCIVDSTYLDFIDSLGDLSYFRDRAILAPTLNVVDEVNEYMLSMIPGDEVLYLSSDSISKQDGIVESMDDLYSIEFLNSISMSGLPNHALKLKVGAPIMLLRNIDKSLGLCNGTRLIMTQIRKHVLEAQMMSGSNAGMKVYIPRIDMSPSDSRLPFTLRRRQFPIMLSFAMTINKSQGQSLVSVGLYLSRPVFTHGQLYVAVSRVRSKQGLKILILDADGNPTDKTSNVVYREIFNNLV